MHKLDFAECNYLKTVNTPAFGAKQLKEQTKYAQLKRELFRSIYKPTYNSLNDNLAFYEKLLQ